jgi:Protein of unknown function (DUF1631)
MGTSKATLLARCIELARQRLSGALSTAIEMLPERLRSNGAYFESGTDRASTAQVISQAFAWRSEIIDAFEREFRSGWERHSLPTAAPQPRMTSGGTELRLIDDATIEEEIAISRLVQTARQRIDDQLRFAVEMRLGDLYGTKRLGGAANPIGPETIFRTLKHACAAASGESEVKTVLVHALHPTLADALTELFREINGLLQDEGILPNLRYEIDRIASEVPTTKSVPPTRIDDAIAKTQERTFAKFKDGEAAALTRLADVLNSAETAANDGPVDLAALVTAVLSGPSGAMNLGAGLLADSESALYRQAIKLPVAAPVADALSKVQSITPIDGTGRARTLSADELIAYLDHVDQVYKHPIDLLTGKLIAAVYHHVLHDDDLAGPVKHELARLQIVALKAALLDRTFFASAEHPFRRMMSQIAKLSVDPQYDLRADGPFDKILHETVEGVLVRFESDLLIFDDALERFSDAIQKHANSNEKSIATIAETLVAKEFIASAIDDAEEQVSLRITDQTPAFVQTFLKETWVPLLAEADVNGLPDEDSYAARIEAAEQLVWSVNPKQATELPRLITILPGLIRALRRGMRAANLSPYEGETFLANLMTTHTSLMQAKRHQSDSSRKRPTGASCPEPSNLQLKKPSYQTATVIHLPDFKRGKIVEFLEEVDVVRRTLVWVSPRNSHYVFSSDKHGQRTLTSAQLAEAMRIGRVVPLPEQESIVDRAVASVTYINQAA